MKAKRLLKKLSMSVALLATAVHAGARTGPEDPRVGPVAVAMEVTGDRVGLYWSEPIVLPMNPGQLVFSWPDGTTESVWVSRADSRWTYCVMPGEWKEGLLLLVEKNVVRSRNTNHPNTTQLFAVTEPI